MIRALQEWAMVLSGVAVFGSLCEVILPEGSFQKYIRLGLGMMLVLALLSPIRGLLHQEWETDEKMESRNAYRMTENMEEKQKKEILRVYQGNLERKILSALQGKLPDFSGEIQCMVEENREEFGIIREVLIFPEKEGVDEEKIQRILTEEFGIAEEQITLRF